MNKNEQMKKVKEILDEHDIEIEIGGCGCCDSPWVTLKYKNKTIINDEENFNFSNIKKEIV